MKRTNGRIARIGDWSKQGGGHDGSVASRGSGAWCSSRGSAVEIEIKVELAPGAHQNHGARTGLTRGEAEQGGSRRRRCSAVARWCFSVPRWRRADEDPEGQANLSVVLVWAGGTPEGASHGRDRARRWRNRSAHGGDAPFQRSDGVGVLGGKPTVTTGLRRCRRVTWLDRRRSEAA